MRLSIVIPAYNEEKRLPVMLKSYAACFGERLGDEVELVVVVNGSSDGTAEVARSIAQEYPQIKVLVEPGKIGKGGAIIMGVKAACGEWIGYADADGATPAESFWALYQERIKADVIVASRWIKGSVMNPKQSFKRRVSSRCFNMLINMLFQFGLKDTQCGAKLVRGDLVKAVLPRLGLTRWAFDVDLLFQLKADGCAMLEVPTVWCDIAGSKIRYIRSSLDMFCAVARLRLLHSPFKWVVDLYNRANRIFRR